MSFISIKNARVSKIIDGKGFEIIETYTNRENVTVDTDKWFVKVDPAKPGQLVPSVGMIVNVSGGFSHYHDAEKCDKYDEYTCGLSVRLWKIEAAAAVASNNDPF